MSGKAGRLALVKVTGAPVVFTNEATTDSGDHQTYQIGAATKSLWDRNTALVVKVDGVVTAEAYTFNRLKGSVTFATIDADRGVVTFTGAYLPASVAAGARQFSLEVSNAVLDDSDFDNVNTVGGFNVKQVGMKSVSGSISRRLRADHYFADALIAGDPVVVELYSDRNTAPDFTLWALLNKEQIQAAVDGTQDGTVDFDGTPDDQLVAITR